VVAVASSVAGFGNGFAMDDFHLILNDPRVHSLNGVGAFFAEPYWPEPFNRDLYRPLSSLFLALQWSAGGGSPLLFRVVSYALYAAVSIAVFALGRRLLPASVALAVALLFAAHPVHVEAVAQGVNQSELWVALIAAAVATRYVDVRRSGWPDAADWAALGALYLVACSIKEHALAIPAVLLAAEITVLHGPGARERLRRLAPGFSALAAVGAGFLAVRTAVLGSFVGSFTAPALEGQGLAGRTLTMLQVVPEWLRLLVFPLHLQGDYSPAEIEQASGWGLAQTAGLVLLLALAALGWRVRRAAPLVPFGLLWAAAAILPVANVLAPTGITMAERTLFLPSVGFLLAAGAAAAGAAGAAAQLPRHRGDAQVGGGAADAALRAGRFRAAAWGAVAVLVLAGAWRSALRHTDWKDHMHFWARTAQDAPASHKAHWSYGQILYASGQQEAGLREYEIAVSLAPTAYWIHREVGDLLRARGDCAGALEWYAESLRIEPEQGTVLLSRIACLMQLGRMEEATAEAARAGRASPPP
jgi:tetratricopeptide (TPR) repeat protein